MNLISIESLSMTYGSPARPILSGIDIAIAEGEFVCVLGQTGCGKSTLLRLVLGSEQPTRGQVLIDGERHLRPDWTRGYVPQKYALFPDRTVLDNITFGPEVREFNLFSRMTPRFFRRRRELRMQAMDYLLRIGLREADAGKYPDQLSGGMQQRVAIAQALMTKPRILLMDEAFSALDPGTRRDMQKLIRQLWRDTRTTVLFVTHNTQEALSMATRVLVLAKEDPANGSQIMLDMTLNQPCREDEMPRLIAKVEGVCGSSREPESALFLPA